MKRKGIKRGRPVSHGKTYTKEYRTWCYMKTRCLNKKRADYKFYGGRGVTICHRWLCSFSNFIKDMGEAPTAHHTIERLDNDQGYSRDNCRWATKDEQAKNKRTKLLIDLSSLSKRTGVPYHTLYWRYRNNRMLV